MPHRVMLVRSTTSSGGRGSRTHTGRARRRLRDLPGPYDSAVSAKESIDDARRRRLMSTSQVVPVACARRLDAGWLRFERSLLDKLEAHARELNGDRRGGRVDRRQALLLPITGQSYARDRPRRRSNQARSR